MSIEIPDSLQWVSYLVGSQWPTGDEDAMYRIGNEWRARAEDMTALIPELQRMRASTCSALQGLTAGAADEQFSLLFDGDASVEKLAKAMAALGDLAEHTGENLEYAKLRILTSLAIAAYEIWWALAQTSVTSGASAAAIPVIEGCARSAIRQIASMLRREVMTDLGEAMTRTTVHRIIKKSGVEMTEGFVQELYVQSILQAKALQEGFDWQRAGLVAVRDSVGGAAQSAVALVGQTTLGNSMAKGAVIGYGAGMAKKVAGALATGQPIDLVSLLGSGPSAATGAVRGSAAARKNSTSPGNEDSSAASG